MFEDFFDGLQKAWLYKEVLQIIKNVLLKTSRNFWSQNLNWYINSVEYINCKNQFDEIYDDIVEGIKVRNKYQWYEEGEKSTKFFLNLEKTKAVQGIVKFFEKLFRKRIRKTKHAYNEFLRDLYLARRKNKFVTKKLVNKM